jgi:2-hydroxychromene-2-carboxylate isomerase
MSYGRDEDGTVTMIGPAIPMNFRTARIADSAHLSVNKAAPFPVSGLTADEMLICNSMGINPNAYMESVARDRAADAARLALNSEELKVCQVLGMEPEKYLREVTHG